MLTQAYTLLNLAILVLGLASNSSNALLKQQAINQANSAILYAQTVINEQTIVAKPPVLDPQPEPDWVDATHDCWYVPTVMYQAGGSYMGKGKTCGG